MRLANAMLALICLAASAAARSESFDAFQPAIYFEVKFGGPHRGLTAPGLDARLQYAGAAQSLLPASAAPAVLDWRLNGEGTAVALVGTPLYVRSWQQGYDDEDAGSNRATKIVATSVGLTAIGVSVVLAAVGALVEQLGESTGEAVAQGLGGGQNGDQGNSDSGNTGSVCVGKICPTGGG